MKIFLPLCMMIFLLSSCQYKDSAAWIEPVDTTDLNDLNLVWQIDRISQFADDENAKLSLYCGADKNEQGEFIFDDRQEWLLIMENSLRVYPLFPRQYIQLGSVSCVAFDNYDDNTFHVMVTVGASAGYEIYDCIYDSEKEAFRVVPVYDTQNIKFTGISRF